MDKTQKLKQLLEKKRKCATLSKEALEGRYRMAYEELKSSLKREIEIYVLHAIHSGFGSLVYKALGMDYYRMLRGMYKEMPMVRQYLTDGANKGDFELIDKAVCLLEWMGFAAYISFSSQEQEINSEQYL